jgi:hypothetical protein
VAARPALHMLPGHPQKYIGHPWHVWAHAHGMIRHTLAVHSLHRLPMPVQPAHILPCYALESPLAALLATHPVPVLKGSLHPARSTAATGKLAVSGVTALLPVLTQRCSHRSMRSARSAVGPTGGSKDGMDESGSRKGSLLPVPSTPRLVP